MLFQIFINFFLLLNTEDILKNADNETAAGYHLLP